MTQVQINEYKNNVVGLNNDSVLGYVESFLGKQSEKTAKNYRSHIVNFFMFACGKELNELAWSDLEGLTYKLVDDYVEFLKKEKLSASTINAKISACKSLFKDIHRDHREIDDRLFDVRMLKVHDNSYDSFTDEECEKLFQYALTDGTRGLGLVKSLFFETAYVTAIRKEALLNLTWKDIKQVRDNDTGKMVWVIVVTDKGNKRNSKPINDEFYEKLCQLKDEHTRKNDKVFNIGEKTLARCLENFCRVSGINKKERNLTIHSIKKAAGWRAMELTGGNIKAVQEFLDHSKASTTMDSYIIHKSGLTEKVSYRYGEKADLSELEKLSKEELLDVIMNKCDIRIGMEILNKAGR